MRIGINGFGRIGRAVFKLNERRRVAEVAVINDIDPDVHNHAYLLKYDSVYGRFGGAVEVKEACGALAVNGQTIRMHACPEMSDVPWRDYGVDLVVDASGVSRNVTLAYELVARGDLKKVVVTHTTRQGEDLALVFGVNDRCYDPASHHVVSTTICDVVASAPILHLLEQTIGIAGGYITTLHPWLSYQNLVDGPVRSVSSPGHMWGDFALGRASSASLIPKNTTLVDALKRVVPDVAARLQAISFRVPTGIVTVSDCTLTLKRTVTTKELNALFEKAAADNPAVIGYEQESLVSIDFAGVEQSAVLDSRWTRASDGGQVKIVFWYDNEMGYSSRVLDAVYLMSGSQASERRAGA